MCTTLRHAFSCARCCSCSPQKKQFVCSYRGHTLFITDCILFVRFHAPTPSCARLCALSPFRPRSIGPRIPALRLRPTSTSLHAFSHPSLPQEDVIVTASADQTVRVWDAVVNFEDAPAKPEERASRRILQGHSGIVNCLLWSGTRRSSQLINRGRKRHDSSLSEPRDLTPTHDSSSFTSQAATCGPGLQIRPSRRGTCRRQTVPSP